MKITSGDVMSRVPLRLSRRSLDFYYWKGPSLTYSSQREYKPAVRDFKIWYGEAVVRRQIVKITSGVVMLSVPLRLSRRSLDFYYGKVPGFTYSSQREYKPAVYFSFNAFF